MSDAHGAVAALDIVLLAAGLSRRFGSPKLTAEAGGATLLERAVEQLAALGAQRLIVVVGPDFANDLPAVQSAGATIVLVATALFLVALVAAPRHGLAGQAILRRRGRHHEHHLHEDEAALPAEQGSS